MSQADDDDVHQRMPRREKDRRVDLSHHGHGVGVGTDDKKYDRTVGGLVTKRAAVV